jgi:glutathione synthase
MSQKDFPDLNQEQLKQLIFEMSQFGLSNGLIMYPPAPYLNYQPVLAPVTLFPTPFPRKQFLKAILIQQIYNKLYANVVSEHNWLTDIIKELSFHDKDFTGKLWDCYLKAKSIGIIQDVSLALTRSDYMYDEIKDEIKQVEFNTVSVSFGGLSPKVGKAHSYLNEMGLYTNIPFSKYYKVDELPISESDKNLAKGLYSGVEYYNKKYLSGENKSIVLMVVQPNERNAFDQRALEYHLLNEFNVISKRVELPKVLSSIKIDENNNKKLYYQGLEVSVVYYRSAYGPAEFDLPETWECRTLLESTLAIKCPSLLTQLSGSKKIQQLLTKDDILIKFLESKEAENLKETFCKIYPLDDSTDGKLAKKLAFEKPQDFVLKPQREGGGNNIYKEDIPLFLKTLSESEWEAYILMELINPKTHKNLILRNGEILNDGIVSELGIFGSYLFNEKSGQIINNECLGHLLRSKTSSSNEGGVAAGYGCVDNLYLY